MKKKFVLFIFLFCAILNFKPVKVNASYDYFDNGGLCVYEGQTIYFPGALHINKISILYSQIKSGITSLTFSKDPEQNLVLKANQKNDVWDLYFRYNGMTSNPTNSNNMYYTIAGQMDGFSAYNYWETSDNSGKTQNINITYTKQAKNELSSAGVCPKVVFIKHKNAVIGQKSVIEQLLFIKNGEDFNKLNAVNVALLSDKYISIYALSTSRFGNKEKYNNYNESTCMNDTDATYYREMFKELEKYPNNYAYVTIYKANKMDKIASSIISRYSQGTQCYNDYPGRQINYNDVVEHARNALAIMNKKAPDTKKYKNECEYILGSKNEKGSFAYYLDISFRFIKFLAPLLLIVLTMIEYIKVIAANDADLISKTNKRTIIRLIFTLLLFMLPTIINTVLSLFGLTGDC